MKFLKYSITTLLFFAAFHSLAQEAIGTNNPNPQAALHIASPNKGLLIPKLALSNATTFIGPGTDAQSDTGMLVFNTNTDTSDTGLNGSGFYYWSTNFWEKLSDLTELNEKTTHVPLWVSNTNGGVYAIHDIVSQSGVLYKNRTGTNTDTAPSTDTTNWEALGDTSIPLWKSNTNGRVYAINDVINHNGILYKNLTGTNTDFPPTIDGANWEALTSSILSDADGDTKIQVEESADEDLIRFDLAGTEKFVMRGSTIEPVNNGNSVFIGENAGLNDNLTNNQNIAIGTNALRDNTAAYQNVAIGQNALLVNTGGNNNFALGRNSLLANTVGDLNVGLGGNTLTSNINGEGNLALGVSSLSSNISGDNNVAIGRRALRLNQSGNNNVAIGKEAGDNLISGIRNTIIGNETGWGVTTGGNNTIIGSRVKGLAPDLSNNIIFSDGAGNIQLQNDGTRWQSEDELQAGSFDTAWQNNTNGGVYAVNHIAIYNGILYKNLTGVNTDTTPDLDITNWEEVGGGSSDQEWVANASYGAGDVVLYNGRRFTNTTSSNTATNPAADILRWEASDLTYSRTLMPRRLQRRFQSNGSVAGSITLGDNSSTSYGNVLFAGGAMTGSGTQYVFYLNQNGNVSKSGGGSWASTSDERTKKDIKDFNVGLEEVIKLRPVSFKYNGKYDTPTDEKEHVSFIAQEVEKVAPRMINKIDIPGSDAVGENALKLIENSDFVPMLVNAVKELKEKNDELEARIKALESAMEPKQ